MASAERGELWLKKWMKRKQWNPPNEREVSKAYGGRMHREEGKYQLWILVCEKIQSTWAKINTYGERTLDKT